MKVFSNFSQAYYKLIEDVYQSPDHISAPRGQKIKEKLGVTFKIKNPRDRLPYLSERDFSVSYYIAESLWYLTGNDLTSWISNYSSFWKNISDDGLTANSAYGSRIFKPHDRICKNLSRDWTQWDYVIDELCRDPDSRRAVIHIRSPQDSILASKDVPCTLSLQFFVRDEAVHMVVSMRSSDLIFGIAYDVPAFTLFQEMLANELSIRLSRKIGLGEYIHTSNSLHIYDRHFEMCDRILVSEAPKETLEVPPLPFGPLPLSELNKFETSCRDSHSQTEIIDLLEATKLDPYWKDWCVLFATHRLSKLGVKNPIKTNFKGYDFFRK